MGVERRVRGERTMNHALHIHVQGRATQRQTVMLSRGKLIVLAILLLAVALAVVNMIFQTRASGRAVAHWGPEASRLILSASQAEIVKLEPVPAGSPENQETEYLDVGSQRFAIAGRQDIAQAHGALHVRRALVADSLYDWGPFHETPPKWQKWRYALRFREGEAEFTILLAEGCVAASSLTDAQPLPVRANDQGGSPLYEFVDEQFPR